MRGHPSPLAPAGVVPDNAGMTRLTVVAGVALVASAALVTGCGDGREQVAATAEPPPPTQPTRPAPMPPPPAKPVPRRCAGTEPAIGGKRVAYAAVARRPTVAFRRPGRGRLASFGLENVNGHATVFGVRRAVLDQECEIVWYRVALPTWPNGSEGYVNAEHVSLYRVRTRIVIDLSQRRLILYRRGAPATRATVAIGSPATPTPTGRFYVDQRLIPGNKRGPWGPAAIGVSARSEVLRDWPQGGPIAIHGTNDPSSIGRAVSNGCLRLPNPTLRRLFAVTDAGTPVIIRM